MPSCVGLGLGLGSGGGGRVDHALPRVRHESLSKPSGRSGPSKPAQKGRARRVSEQVGRSIAV